MRGEPQPVSRSLQTAFLLVLLTVPVHAVAPPPRLTPAQLRLLQQQRRLLSQLTKAQQPAEQAAVAEKILAVERAIFGQLRPPVELLREWLIDRYEEQGMFVRSIRLRRESLTWYERRDGKGHWRTLDARLALEDCRRLARMEDEQRAKLSRARQAIVESGRLQDSGRAADAVRCAQQGVRLYREVLGESHRQHGESLHTLARAYHESGQSTKALPIQLRAVEVLAKSLGKGHPHYASGLSLLASIYHGVGDYRRALPLMEQSLAIRKEALGERHPEYAQALNNLGMICLEIGDHRRALPLYERAVALLEQDREGRNEDLGSVLKNLGTLYKDLGQSSKALALFLRALKQTRQAHGEKHPSYAACLSNLALLYGDRGEYAQALRLHLRALELTRALHGDKHVLHARCLGYLANLYVRMGNYRRALPVARQALKRYETAVGPAHPLYAMSLGNLAGLYRAMGEYRKALPLLERESKLLAQSLGEKHPYYAASLNNLALLLEELGEHQQALKLTRRVLKLCREVFGEKHPGYADSLNNLAALSNAMGDSAKALLLLRRVLQLRGETLGPKHPAYADSLNNLALLYQEVGEFNQARPLLVRAVALKKDTLGERHPGYAATLGNLGGLYRKTGEYRLALPLQERVVALDRSVLGERHPQTVMSLNNLAVLHQELGSYQIAETLLRRVLSIQEEMLGERDPSLTRSLSNLAGLYRATGKHRLALPLAVQSLERTRQALGEGHPGYADKLTNLALLYLDIGDRSRALPLAWQAVALSRRHLELTAAALSERQHLLMAAQMRYRLDLYLTLSRGSPGLAAADHAEVLAWKGAALARQRLRRLAQGEDDPRLREPLAELRRTTGELARLALRGDVQARDRLEALSRRKEELEGELSALSEPFRILRARARLRPDDLQALLPEDVALVDFLVWTRYDPAAVPKRRFESRLAAFVLRKGAAPVRLDLGPMNEIARAASAWRKHLAERTAGPDAAGLRVRELVWAPLERHLQGTKAILLSPDGALAQVPFAALPGRKRGSWLLEETALAVVAVPQLLPDLLEAPAGKGEKASLLVVGDVDFTSIARGGWLELPGTRLEADGVRASFQGRFKSGIATDLRREKASKPALRRALPLHRYAHLATHGFFATASVRSALADTQRQGRDGLFGREGLAGFHPGLLSGIVLAAAKEEDEQDGILTALEVAELDLSGVELAVLSACETGLGELAGGEGVLGLQRAFQAAGAKSLVTSLWSVSDAATSVLMEHFYKHLWGKEKVSKLEALRRAQLFVLGNPGAVEKRARELRSRLTRGLGKAALRLPPAGRQGGRSHPLWWAGFVLSGDWR
jgi:CHAT domain-containing protein/tetratricopeptide (TPR) repeat protein